MRSRTLFARLPLIRYGLIWWLFASAFDVVHAWLRELAVLPAFRLDTHSLSLGIMKEMPCFAECSFPYAVGHVNAH